MIAYQTISVKIFDLGMGQLQHASNVLVQQHTTSGGQDGVDETHGVAINRNELQVALITHLQNSGRDVDA